MIGLAHGVRLSVAVVGLLAAGLDGSAWGQGVVIARPRANRGLGFAPAQPIDPANPPISRELGSFRGNPQGWVGGSYATTAGYGPLDMQVASTLQQYGPLSGFRATTIVVPTYTRGYDGRLRTTPGISFSYPNAPELSPYGYPTQATPVPGAPRPLPAFLRPAATNWIDQN